MNTIFGQSMGNFNPQGQVEVSNCLMYYLNFPPKTGNIAGCSDPLGLSTNQISDDSFFATSWQPGRRDPWYGRLNNESRRSWCSTVSDDNQYIQVNNNIAFFVKYNCNSIWNFRLISVSLTIQSQAQNNFQPCQCRDNSPRLFGSLPDADQIFRPSPNLALD